MMGCLIFQSEDSTRRILLDSFSETYHLYQ